jgi:hypothetical protein
MRGDERAELIETLTGETTMSAVQEPITISVEMEVSRYREFQDEDLVEVWGHVGDYEVCIFLSKADKRVRRIKRGPHRKGGRTGGD